MKQKILQDKYKLWYMFCFMILGMIDQRRGSAVGEVQMLFSNLTGIVIAMLLMPSLDYNRFKQKVYFLWTPICLILTIVAIVLGQRMWTYKGQWITGVLNLTVWSYLLIYIFREWRSLDIATRLKQPFYWIVFAFFILMVLSQHEKTETLWYLLIYGGFYIIGIPENKRKDFLTGMLNGMIAWFFIQQIIAFGFRPYDYVRYRGLYSGETQNGLFYMLVYCAFFVKWLWGKQERQNKWLCFFYFLMAAGNVGFMILAGSRSGLLGAAVITIVILTCYDIVIQKSFYRWMLHGAGALLCIILAMPAVYVTVRYLPTILHHPIWFEGEYIEGESVRSFDPWDSPRYISVEEVIYHNIGRILHVVGIDVVYEKYQSSLGCMKVYAEEIEEPGSSPDNPYMLDDIDQTKAMWDRIVIYSYYWKHLNIKGHVGAGQGFYMNEVDYWGHAHNMFLQTAYHYGIPAGILFILIWIYGIIRAIRMRKPESWVCVAYLLAIACFGMLEMVVTPGQITVPLMWIMLYFAGLESYSKSCRGENIEKRAE